MVSWNEDINPETNEYLKELRGEGVPERERLRLEHFYLAFLILGVGLSLSLLFFIKEMCKSLPKSHNNLLIDNGFSLYENFDS